MPIEIRCESCGKRYRVEDRFAGKRVKCRNCGASIAVSAIDGEDEPQDFSALSAAAMSHDSSESIASDVGPPPSSVDLGAEGEGVATDQPPLPGGFGAAIRAARSRMGVRQFRRLSYPGSKAVDQVLPWVIGAACLIPTLWVGSSKALATTPAWIAFTQLGIIFLLFLVLVIPVTTRGLRMAGQLLHFQLPDTAGWRTLGIFSLPFALAAAFFWQLDGMGGVLFGLAVGAFARRAAATRGDAVTLGRGDGRVDDVHAFLRRLGRGDGGRGVCGGTDHRRIDLIAASARAPNHW